MDDFDKIYNHYTNLKADREEYTPLWHTISKFTGIKVDIDYLNDGAKKSKSRQLDEYIDDPTAALSVTQSGSYLLGIMWGTGADVLALEPSREVLDIANAQTLQPYFDFITEELLEQMNHSEAGLNSALESYIYDQRAFGTSGVGLFKNKLFEQGVESNAFVFKDYGVDTLCIDEGKNGLIETVFATYHWTASRIVGEFCCNEKGLDKAMLAKLPLKVMQAWEKKDVKQQFTLVFGVMPRENYDPKKLGKLGTKYRGVWFFGDDKIKQPFIEEDFATKPIPVARAIKVRGEKYGRASGTMLISMIRLKNFMMGQATEVIEKMVRPSLGIFSNGLFGDSVLDTSPDGLTVFNSEMAGNSGNPIFPVADVGDPTALVQFLMPLFDEMIATAFQIDVLLDFSSAKEMTATESLQRYAIRGKSLSGILGRQKTELLDPLVKRGVNVLMNLGRLGIDASKKNDEAEKLVKLRKRERIIPDAVLEIMKSGKPWYKIRWKNELELLTNTRNVENILKYTQGCQLIASLFPQIVAAVNWYDLLDDWRKSLNIPADKMVTKDKFEADLKQAAEAQQAALASQLGGNEAKAQKDMATAEKQRAESAR